MSQIQIPKLYETENIESDKKIVYQRYEIRELGFYWLIVELDTEQNFAFGFANLNDNLFAEWGYINIADILDNNAKLDRDWKPCKFKEANELCMKEIQERKK